MTSNMAKVIIAADLIDRFGRNKDWRAKVDLNTLNMISADYCILGQTQGVYGVALNKLQIGDSDAYSAAYGAFANFNEEWKEYIKAFRAGAEWTGKVNNSEGTIEGTFVRDNTLQVVVRWHFGITVEPVSYFTSRWAPKRIEPPKPKYIDGRLYQTEDGKVTFMVRRLGRQQDMVRLNPMPHAQYDYGNTGSGSISFYERELGKLVELTYGDSTISAQVDD